MDDHVPPERVPARILRPGLSFLQLRTLLARHGLSIRSLDNHHWQISQGRRTALWMTGEGRGGEEAPLDADALQRLEEVLRRSGLLREDSWQVLPSPRDPWPGPPRRTAILWIDAQTTRVFWINEPVLREGPGHCLGHWLHQEFALHRRERTIPYLRRIVAMLERFERVLLVGPPPPRADTQTATAAATDLGLLGTLLEQLGPDLHSRVVGVLQLEGPQLDDALLFTIARTYLGPSQGDAPSASSQGG